MSNRALLSARAAIGTAVLLVLLAAIPVTSRPATPAATPNALIGSWQFEPSGSSFAGGTPYRSGTARFTVTPRCMQVVVDIVEVTGLMLHFEYCDAGNGSYAPVSGNPFYDSESTTWTDRLAARRTERRGELVTGTTDFHVAADGKSYVTTASRTRPDGKLYTSVIRWNRIGP